MLTALLKNNRKVLERANSYLLPHLNRLIELFEQFEKEAADDFLDIIRCVHLRRGEYLLKSGDWCRHIWVLRKGIARMYICKNGMEKNQRFFFPSEIINSFCSSAFQKPSEASIQLLSDAVVLKINKRELNGLKAKYPVIADIEKLLFECHTNWLEEFYSNIEVLNALERCEYLKATQPYLLECISINHLASYLGVSRKSLTRSRSSH